MPRVGIIYGEEYKIKSKRSVEKDDEALLCSFMSMSLAFKNDIPRTEALISGAKHH